MTLERGHNPSQPPVPDRKEAFPPQVSKVLAGLLESGGNMGIQKHTRSVLRKSGERYVRNATRPQITYGDTREQKLKRFAELFKGNVGQVGPNSYAWTVRDYAAVEIARNIMPWTMLRYEMALRFIDWENANAIQRLALKKRDPKYPVTVNDYIPFIEDPAKLAGVFEAGGRIADHVGITSKNTPLLYTIQNSYEGWFAINNKGSRTLYFRENSAPRFLATIEPHLITPLDEFRVKKPA